MLWKQSLGAALVSWEADLKSKAPFQQQGTLGACTVMIVIITINNSDAVHTSLDPKVVSVSGALPRCGSRDEAAPAAPASPVFAIRQKLGVPGRGTEPAHHPGWTGAMSQGTGVSPQV